MDKDRARETRDGCYRPTRCKDCSSRTAVGRHRPASRPHRGAQPTRWCRPRLLRRATALFFAAPELSQCFGIGRQRSYRRQQPPVARASPMLRSGGRSQEPFRGERIRAAYPRNGCNQRACSFSMETAGKLPSAVTATIQAALDRRNRNESGIHPRTGRTVIWWSETAQGGFRKGIFQRKNARSGGTGVASTPTSVYSTNARIHDWSSC